MGVTLVTKYIITALEQVPAKRLLMQILCNALNHCSLCSKDQPQLPDQIIKGPLIKYLDNYCLATTGSKKVIEGQM